MKTANPTGVKAMVAMENYLMPGSGGKLSKGFTESIASTPQIDFIANAKLGNDWRTQLMQRGIKHSQIGGHVGLAKGVIQKIRNPVARDQLVENTKLGYEAWSKLEGGRQGKYQKITGATNEIEYAPYPPFPNSGYIMPEVEMID